MEHAAVILLSHLILVIAVAPSATSSSTGFSLRLSYTNTSDAPVLPRDGKIEPRTRSIFGGPFVEVKIGTIPQPQTLLLDTGSQLTWIQCQPSIKSFPHDRDLFNGALSLTYRPMASDEPLCHQPWTTRREFDVCRYWYSYRDGAQTGGAIARDILTANSSDPRDAAVILGYIFGCSNYTIDEGLPRNSSGILGMGRGALTLPQQLSQPNFSHCFSSNMDATTYLRFGSDTNRRGNSLPLRYIPFRINNGVDSPSYYYLNALDVSVNNQRLNLQPNSFANRVFFIDSGYTQTKLFRDAYVAVRQKLVEHFERFGMQPWIGQGRPQWSDLCYRIVPARRFAPPTMDIHFAVGDDYQIVTENLFYLTSEDLYCLTISSSNTGSVLGFYQQRNTRIIYDLAARPNGALRFAPEDCSRDPRV